MSELPVWSPDNDHTACEIVSLVEFVDIVNMSANVSFG